MISFSFRASVTCCLAIVMLSLQAKAQSGEPPKARPVLADGLVAMGYADKGAYINFCGPGIKFNARPFTFIAGMLPSLRIKEDKTAQNAPKNSAFTPSLGFGLTSSFKHLVVQVPFYYNAKTGSSGGKWKAGVGLGYKF